MRASPPCLPSKCNVAMPKDDEHEEGQAFFAPEEEVQNAAWEGDGRDQRPVECAPVGPTPPFELVSEFFERIADMRSKRPAGGASGTASKKRALIEQMFIVSSRRARIRTLQGC